MKRPVRILLTVVSVIAAAVCIFCILFIVQYVRGKSLSDKLGESFTSGVVVKPRDPADDGQYMTIDVDFDSLHDINPEIYAWIEVPGTNINYAVVQSTDDLFYNDQDLLLRRQHLLPAVQHHHLPGPCDGAVRPQPPVPDHVCPGEQLRRRGVFRPESEDPDLYPGQGV